MLVKNQIVKLKVNATSLEHYRQNGYNVKVNQQIEVRVEDLTDSCTKKVKVICDYCGDQCEKTYQKYIRGRKFVEKDACQKCFPLKQKDVIQYKYGVDSITELPEFKEKSKQTSLERYGVENPFQSEEVQEKFKKTMNDKYGVEYAQQSEVIREKTKERMIEKYGVDNPFYIDGIKNKIDGSFEFVNGVKVSNPQKVIAYNLKGSLNTNLLGFFVDIYLPNDKIVIEYNGSGHYLSAIHGRTTKENITSKDKQRINELNKEGYKCLVVENNKDKKLSKIRLSTINDYINKLKETNSNSTIYYNIS